MNDYVYTWVIYRNPKDYPGKFVLRKWRSGVGTLEAALEPAAVEETLDAAREYVPEGLVRIPWQPGEDPVIVETWI